jgi:nitrate reductase gamma subunit
VFEALGVSHEAKQLLEIIAGGGAGILMLIGGSMLLHRRLTDPRIRKTSSFADIAILVLLMIQLLLGLSTIFVSLQNLDGGEMTQLMAWAHGISIFELGAADHIQNVSLIFKIHLTLGLTIVLLFPFTRLVHMLSVPVRYLVRPGYQIVRSRRQNTQRKSS